MSAKGQTRQSGKSLSPSFARRILHSRGSDLRAGLSDLRARVDEKHYISIVQELAQQPRYKAALACEPFPRDFDHMKRRKRLYGVAASREFNWTACVLSLFAEQLGDFVARRTAYEQALLEGRLNSATAILADMERAHGVSIWMLTAKLQLLQLTDGLKAQKDLLQAVIASKGLNPFIGWLAFLASYRAEENVFPAGIEAEFADLLAMPKLGDYLRYRILAIGLTEIVDPPSVIEWDEAHPIVDRFQTFVSMCQVEYSKKGASAVSYLRPSLGLVRGVNDPRIKTMLTVMEGTLPTLASDQFDLYTEGTYGSLAACMQPLELLARAELLDPSFAHGFGANSLGGEAVNAMKTVLTASEHYVAAIDRLQKIALIGDKSSWTAEVAAFLNRKHANPTTEEYSAIDRFAALNSASLNPWHVATYAELTGSGGLIDMALARDPNSSALLVRKCLEENLEDATAKLSSLKIPDYRLALYSGHIRFKHGDMAGAVDQYSRARESENEYVVVSTSPYLYAALFALGNLNKAADLVIDHCLSNSGAHRLYPIEELARIADRLAGHIDYVAIAIILHLAARHVHPKWERALSDAYENALFVSRVKTPTEFAKSKAGGEVGSRRLVYFLRFVCVPRVLDDSTSFRSVSEVEQERIAVCQLLTELDSDNSETYATEIRSITRDAQIARLLRQVEASKIYVDEEGVRSALHDAMKASFARFQALVQSPSLEYQAEQITRRLKELVGEKGAGELKNFRLPSSEKESLFNQLLTDFVNQFALNPAYGLDIHLSTSIRHGAFEGHLVAPFVAESLLSTYDKIADRHSVPASWASLPGVTPDEQRGVDRHITRFTEKIHALVESWLKEVLRISDTTSQNGRFNFLASDEEIASLIEAVTPATTYEEFVDQLFAHCWRKLDVSMTNIRAELSDSLLPSVNSAIDALIAGVESNIGHARAQRLVDSAVRAKTDAHNAIAMIGEWFKRPSDLQRSPFDFELAVGVAIKQIANCYVHSRLSPKVTVSVLFRVDGMFLDGIVEVLFILLQNVIRHGGADDGNPVPVAIDVTHRDSNFYVSVQNTLGLDVDIQQRREAVREAQARYEHDTAMDLAGREGGSGLSKVWRILQFDLKRSHSLSFMVRDDRVVEVILVLDDRGMRSC